MLSRFLPFCAVMAFICWHTYRGVERLNRLYTNSIGVVSVSQKMNVILGQMRISGTNLDFDTFVRENLIQSGEDAAKDAWGIPYRFDRKGTQITITSAGPDRVFGTEDDISISTEMLY